MIFTELDGTTREWMLRCFEAEESGGNPYRSEVLSPLGLARWPDLMRQAITDPGGNEVTLAAALNRPGYWRAADARGERVNPAQASERLAITEFNTWYVAGLAARLREEGVTDCRVYRAGIPRWQAAGCSVHEGQTYAVAEIIAGHRVGYWPAPGVPGRLSIPARPGCHHTIERVAALSRSLSHRRRACGGAGRSLARYPAPVDESINVVLDATSWMVLGWLACLVRRVRFCRAGWFLLPVRGRCSRRCWRGGRRSSVPGS